MPAARASRGVGGAKGAPAKRIAPSSADTLPPSTFIKVDFPAPFSPTRPTMRPKPTLKLTDFKTRMPKKDLVMPAKESSSLFAVRWSLLVGMGTLDYEPRPTNHEFLPTSI